VHELTRFCAENRQPHGLEPWDQITKLSVSRMFDLAIPEMITARSRMDSSGQVVVWPTVYDLTFTCRKKTSLNSRSYLLLGTKISPINCTNLHQKMQTHLQSKSRNNQKRAFLRGKSMKNQAPLPRLERGTAGLEVQKSSVSPVNRELWCLSTPYIRAWIQLASATRRMIIVDRSVHISLLKVIIATTL